MHNVIKNIRPIWWAALAGCFMFVTLIFVPRFFGTNATADDLVRSQVETVPPISYTQEQYDLINNELREAQSLYETTAEKSKQLESRVTKLETEKVDALNELTKSKQLLSSSKQSLTSLSDEKKGLQEDNLRLHRELQEASRANLGSDLTGNWKLTVKVDAVISPTSSRAANRVVEYDAWIHVKNGKVAGGMHSIKDLVKRSTDKPSTGSGPINGTYVDGELVFYVGQSTAGAVSRFRLKKQGDQLVGRLEADSLVKGWQVYEGSVVGSQTKSL